MTSASGGSGVVVVSVDQVWVVGGARNSQDRQVFVCLRHLCCAKTGRIAGQHALWQVAATAAAPPPATPALAGGFEVGAA